MTITENDIKALSPKERQELLGILWVVIEEDDYTDILPEESQEEIFLLNERVKEYNRNPSSAFTMDEAIKKLRNS